MLSTLAVLGPRADDLDRRPVAVDVVGTVLAVVLDHEDRRVLPVPAVRDLVDDLADGEVTVGDLGLGVGVPPVWSLESQNMLRFAGPFFSKSCFQIW